MWGLISLLKIGIPGIQPGRSLAGQDFWRAVERQELQQAELCRLEKETQGMWKKASGSCAETEIILGCFLCLVLQVLFFCCFFVCLCVFFCFFVCLFLCFCLFLCLFVSFFVCLFLCVFLFVCYLNDFCLFEWFFVVSALAVCFEASQHHAVNWRELQVILWSLCRMQIGSLI